MNDLTFDDKVDQLHKQLEARERDAMQAEQRLQRLNLPVGSVKGRSYGELPVVAGITATAMVAKADPALAMLLGLPVPRPNYEAAANAAMSARNNAAALQGVVISQAHVVHAPRMGVF